MMMISEVSVISSFLPLLDSEAEVWCPSSSMIKNDNTAVYMMVVKGVFTTTGMVMMFNSDDD